MKKVRKSREPSRASLREIPEIDLQTATVRRDPYAERVAASGIIHVRRGRPRKGTETGLTEPRSVRFPLRSGNCSRHERVRRGYLFTQRSGWPSWNGRRGGSRGWMTTATGPGTMCLST